MNPPTLPQDLDAEHAEILARLALFRDRVLIGRPIPELRDHLSGLHDAITVHFRLEQDTMRTLRYGGLWEHVDEHLIIWHTFLRLMDACEATQFEPSTGTLVFTTMSALLQRHVEKHDRAFFLFVEKKTAKK